MTKNLNLWSGTHFEHVEGQSVDAENYFGHVFLVVYIRGFG